MRIIGLAGRAGAGKDSVANILATDGTTSRVAFADPLRDGLIAMFGLSLGLDRHALTDPARKERLFPELETTPRRLMQTLGTDWARKMIHPDVWVRVMDRRIKHHAMISRTLVITDVRFQNEAEWIYRKGGEV